MAWCRWWPRPWPATCAPSAAAILSIEVVCEGEHDPYGEANGAGEGAVWDGPDVNAKLSAATPPSVRRPGETEGAPWTPIPGRFGVNGRGLSGARQFFALNEAAITRGAMGRIIELTLNVSGVDVARMRGDGLVVSTATGSTAYALSAGGPLVSPGFKGMIAVPLAPHTLRSRAVVTDASDVIEVGFDDADEFREATLVRRRRYRSVRRAPAEDIRAVRALRRHAPARRRRLLLRAHQQGFLRGVKKHSQVVP